MSSDQPNLECDIDPIDALVRQATEAVEQGQCDAFRPLLVQFDQVSKGVEKHRLRLLDELERLRKMERQWMARAIAAVQANDDELARRALSRKCQHEGETALIREDLESVEQLLATLAYHQGQLGRALGESDIATPDSVSGAGESDNDGKQSRGAGETSSEPLELSDPDISVRLVALKRAVEKGTITAIIGK